MTPKGFQAARPGYPFDNEPMAAKTLNERQKEVLHWINDGCPADSVPQGNYKISARSLEGHGLVKIKGHGQTWKATVTARGKRVLAATEPLVKQRKRTAVFPPRPIERPAPVPPPPPKPSDEVVEALYKRLRNPKGVAYRALCSEESFKTIWEPRLKALAHREDLIGEDMVLHYEFAPRHYLREPASHVWVALVKKVVFDPRNLDIATGEKRVNKFHPMVGKFSEGKHFKVSPQTQPRARRLLHVLFKEVERLGWTVAYERDERYYSYAHNVPSYVKVKTKHRSYEVKVVEAHDSFQREPTKQEIEEHRRWAGSSDMPTRKFYTQVKNGRLSIEVGFRSVRDTKRKPERLDTELSDLLDALVEIELADSVRAEMKEIQDSAWQRRLDTAAKLVAQRVQEDHEWKTLTEQAARWHEYVSVQQFLAAAREGGVDLDYLAWSARVVGRVKPLSDVEIPAPAKFDRYDHRAEIEAVAGRLTDDFQWWDE